MRIFINKHWKILLIGIMTVALLIAIYLVIDLSRVVKANKVSIDLLNTRLTLNNTTYEKNLKIMQKLDSNRTGQQIVIITTKENYESVKNNPVNTNISDHELIKELRKYGTNNLRK